MDHKKDIGRLFKQKLDGATKQPNKELWDNIEVSLDKRDKKRRSLFFFWIATGTTAIVLLLLFLNSSVAEKDNGDPAPPSTKKANVVADEISTTSELNSEKNNAFPIRDSISSDGLSELAQKELTDLNKRNSSNENKITTKSDAFMDDSVTIKTTYHYYNGETKQMLETTNKSVIDSLLEQSNTNIDSLKVVETKILNPRKLDSLNHPN